MHAMRLLADAIFTCYNISLHFVLHTESLNNCLFVSVELAYDQIGLPMYLILLWLL